MADPNSQLVGIVIKADGRVPFDHNCHPEVRKEILAHLADNGHTLEPVEGTNHVRIVGWKPGMSVHRPTKA
jgi:hypothetical protein